MSECVVSKTSRLLTFARKSSTDEILPFRSEIALPPSHLEALCHALICNPLQMSLGGYNEDCLVDDFFMVVFSVILLYTHIHVRMHA